MCDSALAPPHATAECSMLFGKNSDRQRNEAQVVEYFPSTDHPSHAVLRCTYVQIPQVRHTYGAVLCRPFWIWGAEMGANEHGVVIGNEGLHARIPAPEEMALTGMDLLRLALERGSTAAEATEVLTTLLERHGQGGNCGHLTPSYYNNGFMVADAKDAFVLETVGRQWVLERAENIRTLSNRYSIEGGKSRVSAGLPELIRRLGWARNDAPNYADVIADPGREHIGNAGGRRARSTALLQSLEGKLRVEDMIRMLRDHGSADDQHSRWRSECLIARTLCMHAGADDRNSQTVGAMVSEVRSDSAVHWVTATAAPCISIFKPVLLDVPLPNCGLRPTDQFDPHSLWWRHEQLHRTALQGDFARFLDDIGPDRDALEADFRARVNAVTRGGSALDRSRVVRDCWEQAIALEDSWRARIRPSQSPGATPHGPSWTAMSRLAGLDSLDGA